MNLKEDLLITCRTTCGCGNPLVKYTHQIETTHYLLTCVPYSEKYNHSLLIAIDKNSPVFEKARKWDDLHSGKLHLINDYTFKELTQNSMRFQKIRELIEQLIDEFEGFELGLESEKVCKECGLNAKRIYRKKKEELQKLLEDINEN